VKEILVDDDTIVIRHSIPAPTESTDGSGPTSRPKVANRQSTQVTFCVRGVISPILSNLFLHYTFDPLDGTGAP
jgi:hypothetical protein